MFSASFRKIRDRKCGDQSDSWKVCAIDAFVCTWFLQSSLPKILVHVQGKYYLEEKRAFAEKGREKAREKRKI